MTDHDIGRSRWQHAVRALIFILGVLGGFTLASGQASTGWLLVGIGAVLVGFGDLITVRGDEDERR